MGVLKIKKPPNFNIFAELVLRVVNIKAIILSEHIKKRFVIALITISASSTTIYLHVLISLELNIKNSMNVKNVHQIRVYAKAA